MTTYTGVCAACRLPFGECRCGWEIPLVSSSVSTGEKPETIGLKDYLPITVHWLDAASYGNRWIDGEDIEGFEGEPCITRGFLVHETEEYLYIAQTIGVSGAYNVFLVPKGCITKRIE